MFAETTTFIFKDSRLCEIIDPSLLISKTKFIWGGRARFQGGTSGKIGTKLENAQFPRALKEFLPFVLEW